MIDPKTTAFGRQFGLNYSPMVESVLHYPHPLTGGGLIVGLTNDASDLIDLVGAVYQEAPPGLSLHCLRHRELFQLALPGIFAPPFSVNERPHLPYFLKHKGSVLFGQDWRGAIQPTTDPGVLLIGHIEGCMDSLRRYGILPALLQRKYDELAAMLRQELIYLMSTALLLHNQWDINLANLPDLFWQYFPDERLNEIWRQFGKSRQRMNEAPSESAYHMVWLFERFLYFLEDYAS